MSYITKVFDSDIEKFQASYTDSNLLKLISWKATIKLAKTKVVEASWKDNITEKLKRRSSHNLKEGLTFERLVIPRPITEVIKEVLQYPINIETKEPLANQSNEKKICEVSELKCLNYDVFFIFYEDDIYFKIYTNSILTNSLKPADNLYTEKIEQLRKQ